MEQEKNNTFSWVLRFATQCKGKMTASVLLAVLGSVCGIVPYFAVSQIVIQICGQNYDLIPIGFWALAALLGYLGSTWFGTVSTILSHRSAFTILKNIRTELTAKLSCVPMGYILDTPSGKFKTLLVDTVEKLELPAGTHDTRTDSEYSCSSPDVDISFYPGLAHCLDFADYNPYWTCVLHGDDEGLCKAV